MVATRLGWWIYLGFSRELWFADLPVLPAMQGPPFLISAETVNFGTGRQGPQFSGGASGDSSGLGSSMGLELELLEDAAYR